MRFDGSLGVNVDEELERQLSKPWTSCLFFGAVFVGGIVVKLVLTLIAVLVSGASFLGEAAGFLRVAGVALVFVLGAGLSSAFLRRTLLVRSAFATRNLASGLCAGVAYAGACVWFFGKGMGWGAFTLAAAVFAGVAWAFTSGLNSI